jgi:hypothetical protein
VPVADLRIHVEVGRIEQSRDPGVARGLGAERNARARIPDDTVGSLLDDRRDHRVGDLAEGFVPRDSLPLARAALSHSLERIFHPRGVVHSFAEAAALLAAARVEIRHIRSDLRVVGGLLLAPDDPVLDVHVPGAVGLVPAVHPMAAAHDLVPAPALAVDVAPVPVLGRGRQCRRGGFRAIGAGCPILATQVSEAQRQRQRAGGSRNEEAASIEIRRRHPLFVHSIVAGSRSKPPNMSFH